MKVELVLTTIRRPNCLMDYSESMRNYGHDDVGFQLVADYKTPIKETIKLLRDLEVHCQLWTVTDQKKWLKDHIGKEWREYLKILPYYTDGLRSFGYLTAVENGADIVITVDDDNYPRQNEDYFQKHKIVGSNITLKEVSSNNNWFNTCSLLSITPKKSLPIYPRGFPYSKRGNAHYKFRTSSGRVVLNLGLWVGAPDVDAITRLEHHNLESINVPSLLDLSPLFLAKETFAPIPTQNTAFHKEILPCYYYIFMGKKIGGLRINRYGDIWSGLFAKKIIDAVGDHVTVGCPITIHKRNPHDIFEDLKEEFWGIIISNRLIDIIENMDISSKTYIDFFFS